MNDAALSSHLNTGRNVIRMNIDHKKKKYANNRCMEETYPCRQRIFFVCWGDEAASKFVQRRAASFTPSEHMYVCSLTTAALLAMVLMARVGVDMARRGSKRIVSRVRPDDMKL
mgnify:CR=1 FL=1